MVRAPERVEIGASAAGEFQKLWVAKAISTLGSGVTGSALPLIAALVLGASASEMGWLGAVETAPVLIVGMLAGVWVDRVRRRPLLIGADLGRAVLLASIPIVAAFGALRMELLLLVAAATGVLTVLFDVAYQSFVPNLVGNDGMLAANSQLATVDAIAEITTPGVTGALVQVIAAPLVIVLDSISFVGSALFIARIRSDSGPTRGAAVSRHVWRDMALGWRGVTQSPVLRTLAGWEASTNFFGMFIGALYVLYGLRELGLSPVFIGVTIGIGGVSNLLGTLIVTPLTHRFGVGPTMISAAAVRGITPFLIPLAPSEMAAGFLVLALAQASDLIHPLFDINALTLRQVTTPEHLLGRVNATLQVIGRGVIPFGALAGGFLGDAIGLRPTLLIAATGLLATSLWLVLSLSVALSHADGTTSGRAT